MPGIDGVDEDEDGRHVYFILPAAPFGSPAERCLVDARASLRATILASAACGDSASRPTL